MPRPLLLLTLLAAALATGLMAYTLLGRDGAGGRHAGDRSVAGEERGESADAPLPDPGRDEPEAGTPAPDDPPAGVRGLVADPEGRPVPGARVAGWPGDAPVVFAGPDGSFSWPDASVARVAVLADGYLPLVALAPAVDDTRYELVPAARLSGRVVDESGGPVAGATVWLIHAEHVVLDDPPPGRVVASGGDGRFAFPGVPPGRFDLGARDARHGIAFARDLEFGTGGAVTRDLVLPSARGIDVTVLGATEETRVFGAHPDLRDALLPPGGLEVLADALVGRAFAGLPVVSAGVGEVDADGRAEVRVTGLPPGRVDLEARAPGRITEEGLGTARGVAGNEAVLELVASVMVELIARDGSTGARIEPAVEYRRDDDGVWIPMATEGGRLKVPLDAARRRVRFMLDGYQTMEAEVPAGLHEPSPWRERHWPVVMVPIAGGETGTLLLEFAPPLSAGDRVGVVARDASGGIAWTGHLTADGEGPQRAGPMPVGSYRLSVLATGKVPVVLPNVVVRRGIEETYRVTLSDGGGLEMRVVDPDGELLDEVHIRLTDPSGAPVDVHVLTMVSEGRGFVSINYLPSAAAARADSGLAAGAYTLTAVREGYAPASTGFTVRGTEVARVELTLRPASAAGGRR